MSVIHFVRINIFFNLKGLHNEHYMNGIVAEIIYFFRTDLEEPHDYELLKTDDIAPTAPATPTPSGDALAVSDNGKLFAK